MSALEVTATRRAEASFFDALAWEMRKLVALARTRWAISCAIVVPVIAVIAVRGQQRPPKDSLFGRQIHESGYAVPLLILGFAAQWAFPLLTALVAGDIFASEDHLGTWKTVLTRSVSRAQIFWAKTLTAVLFAVTVTVLIAASTIAASVILVGHQDLVGLSGQLIPSGTALRLVIESWATALAPMLGFTCLALMLSVLTRSPAFGIAAPVVIGFVMQLLGALGSLSGARPILLSTPFESWHGLLAQDAFHGPLMSGLIVCAVWCAVCLAIGFISLRRRDVTGG